MKRSLFFAFLFCIAFTRLSAQTSFNTLDSVDVNNINAAVLVHGDMWWQPDSGKFHCYFPADSTKNISGPGAIWMSGYDAAGQLHIAAQTYRQNGNDYWPGPLNTSDTLIYTTSQNWAKIWKVSNSDIQYFLSLSIHTVSNTPQSVLTWPGKGNVNAQGNAGISLTITNDMAPFVDLNGNGIYEPLSGEYPDIKGDQALWWVFSDNGPTHTTTNGRPLDVEIHAMAYAYKRNTLIDNVVYYEYSIVNRSSNTYNNFRIAQFDMPVLGRSSYFETYIGFDSAWRMSITYNGTNDNGGGFGTPRGYGLNPPISGITMIALPGDVGSSYIPVGNFIYYNNDASIVGNPAVDTEYNNYMRGKFKNGEHVSDDYTGSGVPTVGYGSGPDCNYVFTGDPSINTQWSECATNNTPGDRRYVLSSNDFTLSAGSTQKIVLALVVADTLAGGCPFANFNGIGIVADTAWANYYYPPAPIPSSVSSVAQPNSITIYPNPAHDKLYIENTGAGFGEEYISIYNSIGQLMNVSVTAIGTQRVVNLSPVPPGLYHIVYRKGPVQKDASFIKE